MKRIQMRRTAGWKKPPHTIYVGRPTIWGNPWRVGGKATRRCAGPQPRPFAGRELPPAVREIPGSPLGPKEAVAEYERALTSGELKDRSGKSLWDRVHELRGFDLACWCKPGQACHADVLLRYANSARPW